MQKKQPLEIYIHIPFCVRKCDYCDFLSAPAKKPEMDEYLDALIQEIHLTEDGRNRPVTSVFIGGGTPSLPEPSRIAEVLSEIRTAFHLSPDAEITIEANPGTLSVKKLQVYREAGINRLSLGLQSCHDGELSGLGRIHTFEDFLDSFRMARECGFRNINVDLMFAIPGQTRESWMESLHETASLGPEHISAYSLILEEGTPLAARKDLVLPDEDTEYQMYDDTERILRTYGYQQYEISNYARQGKACRHNIGYWTGEEYAGLGLGASSYVKGHRFHSERNLKNYLSVRMQEDLTPLFQDVEALTLEDQMEEFMFLGLRMTKGVSGADFMHRFGFNMFDVFAEAIHKHTVLGLLKIDLPYLRLTEKGLDLSNRVFADFYGTIHRGE